MGLLKVTKSSRLLASLAATALIATPVMVLADASAPSVMKAKPKKRIAPKKRMRAKPVARVRPAPAPEPVMAQPAPEVVEAPPPPPPPPEPAPAPVAEAPAPTPPAPVAVKKGGGNSLLYIGAFAAAVGGIVAATSRGNDNPRSP